MKLKCWRLGRKVRTKKILYLNFFWLSEWTNLNMFLPFLKQRLSFPGCIESGFSYPGNDILVIHGLASAVLCQRYCSNHPACSFFTWDSLTRVCFLKWGNATQTRIAAPGHSSGPSNCPPQNDTSFAVAMPKEGETIWGTHTRISLAPSNIPPHQKYRLFWVLHWLPRQWHWLWRSSNCRWVSRAVLCSSKLFLFHLHSPNVILCPKGKERPPGTYNTGQCCVWARRMQHTCWQ